MSNTDFLRMSCNARRKALGQPELDPLEFYAFLTPKLDLLKMGEGPQEVGSATLGSQGPTGHCPWLQPAPNSCTQSVHSCPLADIQFLNRNVNEGFSGGEKKRNEILQLAVLQVRPEAAACPAARLLSVLCPLTSEPRI